MMTDTFFRNAFSVSGGRFEPRGANRVASWLRNHPRFPYLPNLVAFHGEASGSADFSFIYFGQVCHYSALADSLYCFNDPNFEDILSLDGKIYFCSEGTRNYGLMIILNNAWYKVSVQGMPPWNEREEEKPGFIAQPENEAPLLIYKQDIWKLRSYGSKLYLEPFCKGCSPSKAYITSAQVWEEKGLIFLGSNVKGIYIVRAPFLKSIVNNSNDHTPVEYAQAEIVPGIINTPTGLAYSSQGKLLPGGTRIRFPLQ